jgi:hypothetical protein
MIDTLRGTNIFGAKHAPDGFVEWAIVKGAVEAQIRLEEAP